MEIWYETNVTDEDIKTCPGDYYGCEVCRHLERCTLMRLEKLIDVMKEKSNVS